MGAITIKSNLILEGVEGVQLQLNQISYLLDKQQTGEQFQRSSPSCKGSESHVRLPSIRIQQRDEEFPRNLTLRASRTSMGLTETKTPLLEGTHKILCTLKFYIIK